MDIARIQQSFLCKFGHDESLKKGQHIHFKNKGQLVFDSVFKMPDYKRRYKRGND